MVCDNLLNDVQLCPEQSSLLMSESTQIHSHSRGLGVYLGCTMARDGVF
jgi:hypothetical protein